MNTTIKVSTENRDRLAQLAPESSLNEALSFLLQEVENSRRMQDHLEALRSLNSTDQAEEIHNAKSNVEARQDLADGDLSW